jgi:hypothetical protein
MTSGPTSDTHLRNTLHNNPDAYWCPHCWKWRLDCEHLVPELTTRFVQLDDWMLKGIRYDRERRILELQLNAGGAYQHRGVPLAIAVGTGAIRQAQSGCDGEG